MKFVILSLMTVFTFSSFGADFVNVALPASKTKDLIHKIGNMLSLYKHDCQTFPTSLAALKQNLENCKNWGPAPYASASWDFKDGWNNTLTYTRVSDGYILKSLGADGKEGGIGPNMDILSQIK